MRNAIVIAAMLTVTPAFGQAVGTDAYNRSLQAPRIIEMIKAKMPRPVKGVTMQPHGDHDQYSIILDLTGVKNAPHPTITFELSIETGERGDALDDAVAVVAKIASEAVRRIEAGEKLEPRPAPLEFEIPRKRGA